MAPSNRRSLNARKMEKNFIAVIEKGYTRQPATTYPLALPDSTPLPNLSHYGFILREFNELRAELFILVSELAWDDEADVDVVLKRIDMAKDEIADVSNTLDYCYERLSLYEDEYNGKKNKEE